ncbi:hypothetical protein ACH5AL_15130 [Actinacidiphila glaucinigra]|uniref:hypothetical protein n=1 Tax=Actinacidiphila glaucinigra TaxID=235986 RepID=UPI00378831C7
MIAGISTLLFTGIATYYGARVSADQLEQSREDAEQKTREQATRISFWSENRKDQHLVHLVNRSPDPLFDAYFRILAIDLQGGHDSGGR